MNDLQIFNNSDFGQVRTWEENGQILFCGIDIAGALGYARPRDAISAHCKGAVKRRAPTNSGIQEMTFVSKGDVYRLIAHSKLPKAEEFEHWIFDEVVPSVCETGSYIFQPMTQAEMLAAQAQLLVDMEKRMDTMQRHTNALEAKVDKAITVFSRPSEDQWKEDTDNAIKKLCAEQHRSILQTKGQMYDELERTAGCSINSRLSRLRARKRKAGMRRKDAMALNKLDAIAVDKQLRVIFEGIVRKYQAKAEMEVL